LSGWSPQVQGRPPPDASSALAHACRRARRSYIRAVKRTETLDTTTAPDGTELTLFRHDGAYYIRTRGVELMSTRRHHSEERLAELVCAPLGEITGARVLVGGLGFGFTLRAALRLLGSDADVLVVELLEGVIRWNRNPDYELAADALADARVTLRQDDVAHVLAASPGRFHGIMLDVDNGADPLTTTRNVRLYRAAGIRRAVAALRPGGRVAYWSADRDPALEMALKQAGLGVDVTTARAHTTSGPWHYLYLGTHA
jgi:spermidine synthase